MEKITKEKRALTVSIVMALLFTSVSLPIIYLLIIKTPPLYKVHGFMLILGNTLGLIGIYLQLYFDYRDWKGL